VQERVDALGGRLSTQTQPDGGFELNAALPYNRQTRSTQKTGGN
jgi:signal transduction histidine kinase